MAEALHLDPAEVRRRNLIQPDEFPYAVGMWFRDSAPLTYDSGDYPELLRRALAMAQYEDARREQERLRAAEDAAHQAAFERGLPNPEPATESVVIAPWPEYPASWRDAAAKIRPLA